MTMLKTWIGILATLMLLGACAEMSTYSSVPPVAIQSTPGKAVIYVVRTRPDVSYLTAQVALDGDPIGATHAGTYMRLEVTPGRHRLSGYGEDNGAIALDVQADRIYFVRHTVAGSWRATNPQSFFQLIDEQRARAALNGAQKAGA
jgi:hypothetical protein